MRGELTPHILPLSILLNGLNFFFLDGGGGLGLIIPVNNFFLIKMHEQVYWYILVHVL